MKIKESFLQYYENNEVKIDILFFLGGFFFDALMVGGIDEPMAILQQIFYLGVIGSVMAMDLLSEFNLYSAEGRWAKIWQYRNLAVHFFLGTLLNIYSLFFIKSASFFASFIFLLFLLGLMIANELKVVKKSPVNIKIILFVVCLFSFFSILTPVVLGFIGWTPFLISFAITALVIVGMNFVLARKFPDPKILRKHLLLPSGGVLVILFAFYLTGLLPPVPLAVRKMGVYHEVKKEDGKYLLYNEKASWKFWQNGDQDFLAEPGDRIYFFASVFSPARFEDTVILRWMLKERSGWTTTDRIPMKLVGGRKGGFRGFTMKEKYSEGSWQVRVETTDHREIGRMYFKVTQAPAVDPARAFQAEVF